MNMQPHPYLLKTVWMDKPKHDEAESRYHEECTKSASLEGGEKTRVEKQEESFTTSSGWEVQVSSPESLNGEPTKKKQRRRKRSPKIKSQQAGLGQALTAMMSETIWFEKSRFEEAECAYQKKLADYCSHSALPKALEPKLQAKSNVAHCRNRDVVACHHVVDCVWVNKPAFDDAECSFMERLLPCSTPTSLAIAPLTAGPTPAAMQIPDDEGYLTATPTPATPGLSFLDQSNNTAPVLPAPTTHSINGMPQIPSCLRQLASGVWLEKPIYDQAEKSYYERLCDGFPPAASMQKGRKNRRNKKVSKEAGACNHASGSASNSGFGFSAMVADSNGSILQGTEDDDGRLILKAKEAESNAISVSLFVHGHVAKASVRFFLHQDSERVWLSKPLFDAAEKRHYEAVSDQASRSSTRLTVETSMPGLAAPAPRQQANTMSAEHLAQENIWFDKYRYDDAERRYYEQLNGPISATPAGRTQTAQENGANTILQDIARARENIQKSLAGLKTTLHPTGTPSVSAKHPRHSARSSAGCTAGEQSELVSRISSLELENRSLYSVVEDLRLAISKLETRVSQLEKSPAGGRPTLAAAAAPCTKVEVKKEEVEDDDDDIDLFGSDEEEDAEAARIREERLQQYAAKKAKKPALIAKSSILLDVKPWDDETDMVKMEECVRSVQADGLLWGSSKLVPVGYGIKKLQIQCVVEDDKVGTDMLEEEITKFEDLVQSVDVAAFNKI
ncbi:eukaryotic translation elongation factor 1 delta b (guanine nucleotide exchange protein) isoform X2 [Polyodon spathula]|uniref:eukaryotic translation elongation factor 1 delta b (guanine nucleotide exchange protein) isoform X2 n=1 Tax=Polyodon spathula TaxID=7913 RepID=UPI001B7E122A|nr:eukaryotic translation elongation factor 1 delta b (guanine nucleotide exchange protein) isoform X2 [Polyodon spathula]